MANQTAIIPRPTRRIGDGVFRTIVKMAYEMGRAQEIKDEKEAAYTSLLDLIGRAATFHVKSEIHKPRGGHSVLATGKLRSSKTGAELMMDSTIFTIKGVKCLHRLLVQKSRGYTHNQGQPLNIYEFGDIILQGWKWDKEKICFRRTLIIEEDDYSSNDDYVHALHRMYSGYINRMDCEEFKIYERW